MARRRRESGSSGSRRRRKSRMREEATCRFCRDKVQEVDYKDVSVLTRLTTQQGKMYSRKRSGNCARHQRSFKRAVKRARYMALMPYVS